MYRYIFNRVKSIIPKISETEIIALKSGGVSIDREIFKGHINYCKLYKPIQQPINNVMEKEIDDLLQLTGPNSIYPKNNIHYVMSYLGNKGFLSMIIDKKYGGNRLPIETQSRIFRVF